MAFSYSSYYGLVRVTDSGPEVKGWAATDFNPEIISLILRYLSAHTHGGATPIRYPGYNTANPATPLTAVLTEIPGTGVLGPGVTVGVRLAYLNSYGLETESSPEVQLTTSSIANRPGSPVIGTLVSTPVPGAVGGGTYNYVLTKAKGSGETQVSGAAQVDVPFSSTGTTSYTVPLTFSAINSYTDGTTTLKLYRSTGIAADYQLLKTISTTSQTTYTDVNTIENTAQAPPTINTFDKNKSLSISYSGFTHPAEATKLRVYVTQNPGVYGTNHLLREVDLTTPFAVNATYLGSEVLNKSWPKEFTQIPSYPSKVNLRTEAFGGPLLTNAFDGNGFPMHRMILGDERTTTPIDGNVFWDRSVNSLKLRMGGSTFTLTTPTGTYVHPTTEAGGHAATGISFGSQNLNTVAGIIANSAAGQVRKRVQAITKNSGVTTVTTTQTAATPVPNLFSGSGNGSLTAVPEFAGQWLEVDFGGHFLHDTTNGTANFAVEINGITQTESVRALTIQDPGEHYPLHIHFATPISNTATVKALWWTNFGTITAFQDRRFIKSKLVF